MKCKRAQEAISRFLDDRLDPTEQSRLNRHLERCEECSTYLEHLREGLSMLRELPLEEPSQNFEWNLKRRLQEAVTEHRILASRGPEQSFWPRFAISAAAALLISLGGASLWYSFQGQRPSDAHRPALVAGGEQPAGDVMNVERSMPLPPGGDVAGPNTGFQPVGESTSPSFPPRQRGTIKTADPDVELTQSRVSRAKDRADSLAVDEQQAP